MNYFQVLLVVVLFFIEPSVSWCAKNSQHHKSKQKCKTRVLDDTGQGVAEIRLYHRFSLVFRPEKNKLELADNAKPSYQTDANGYFVFDKRRSGGHFLLMATDDSLSRMGYLSMWKGDLRECCEIRLASPGTIKATIDGGKIPLKDIHISIDFRNEHFASSFSSFISVDYHLDKAETLVPIIIPCPSGIPYLFQIEITSRLMPLPLSKEIDPLQPGEVLDLGVLEVKGPSEYELVGQKAPPLMIAEWIKGTSVVLEELRGKTVLLDFWAKWCPSCREKYPMLVNLDERYAKDGLVIIAIHDSSESKKSLSKWKFPPLDEAQFRNAIDKQDPEQAEAYPYSKGATIRNYGIKALPSQVLISPNGLIHHVGLSGLEEEINFLLYGHRNVPKAYHKTSSPNYPETSFRFWTQRLIIIVLVVVLGLFIFFKRSQRSRKACSR